MCYRKMDECKTERKMQFVVGLGISTCNHTVSRNGSSVQETVLNLRLMSLKTGGVKYCSLQQRKTLHSV